MKDVGLSPASLLWLLGVPHEAPTTALQDLLSPSHARSRLTPSPGPTLTSTLFGDWGTGQQSKSPLGSHGGYRAPPRSFRGAPPSRQGPLGLERPQSTQLTGPCSARQ
ncbi:unnamed protein product, partial [Polarella glacialis]